MKIQILEKAWVLNPDCVTEPWFVDDCPCYGTRGQAKVSLMYANDGLETRKGKSLNILNIKVKRDKEQDKVLFDGESMRRYQIKDKLREYKIKQLPKDKFYYIQDARSYVGNAVLWHAINGCGYVTDLSKAEKLSWEGVQKFKPRDTDIIWESEHVEKAIRQYVDMQGLDSEKYSF